MTFVEDASGLDSLTHAGKLDINNAGGSFWQDLKFAKPKVDPNVSATYTDIVDKPIQREGSFSRIYAEYCHDAESSATPGNCDHQWNDLGHVTMVQDGVSHVTKGDDLGGERSINAESGKTSENNVPVSAAG